MFITIMSGVIGEVTRQSQATVDTRTDAAHSPSRAAGGARRPRAKTRPFAATRSTAALPGTYRVLAESFRRAVGFQG